MDMLNNDLRSRPKPLAALTDITQRFVDFLLDRECNCLTRKMEAMRKHQLPPRPHLKVRTPPHRVASNADLANVGLGDFMNHIDEARCLKAGALAALLGLDFACG
ncbi:hypothetical protein NWF24_17685 [Variovorax paradoxus]|nr:hypothetical protein [Variovorax paradoxus]UVH54679.1 hypothetical protein NWF24_17685 [Variovorax paradoxus]